MRTARTLVAAILVAALAACQSNPSTATPPPASPASVSASPSPSASAPSARELAIAAYKNLWNAYITAVEGADHSVTPLKPYVSGDALDVFVAGLKQVTDQGLRGRGNVVLGTPTVVSVGGPANAPTVVSLSDCVNTAGTHLYKVDGSAYHDSPGGKRLNRVQVNLVGGTWKVTEWAIEAVGTC